jgi:hypothetical protein
MPLDHSTVGVLIWAVLFFLLGGATYGPGIYICHAYREKLFGASPPSTLGEKLRALLGRRYTMSLFAASLLGTGWLSFFVGAIFMLLAVVIQGIVLGS